jgi:hypothetical protein
VTALRDFEAGVDQVGLGPADRDLPYGFVLSGGYTRAGQKFGSPTEFGGQNELISDPVLSRWNQDDWSGGAYQYTWGKDPAMFSGGGNIRPSQFDRTLRTIPPLARYINFSGTGQRTPLLMTAVDGNIVAVFTCGVAKWALASGSTTLYGDTYGHNFLEADWIRAACYDPVKKEVLMAVVNYGVTPNTATVERLQVPGLTRPHTTTDSEYNTFDQPSNGGRFIRAMAMLNNLLVVQSGASAFALDMPDNNGDTFTWKKLGRLPGDWKDSIVFNGALYILCSSIEGETQLVLVDPKLFGTPGVSCLLPVCDFPYNFRGDSIQVLGGRLYVGGSGTDTAGGDRYSEFYEVTGASLRLVRTFEPEARMQNAAHRPKTIRTMVASEGLIWLPDTGRGFICYDPTTDSLYPSSLLQGPDGVREFWKTVHARERIYAYVTHPLDSSQNGLYRIAQGTDPLTASYFEGFVYTSDFGPQPDRKKRWSKATVLTRYGGAALAYSIDNGAPGGDTFTELPVSSVETHGDAAYTTFDLSGIPLSGHVRLRIRLPRGQEKDGFTELVGMTCAFAFLDSGKWAWSFTINGTERVELMDGSVHVQDIHDIGTELRRWWREQVPLKYVDTDGVTYAVVVSDVKESQPFAAPAITPDGDDHLALQKAPEAFFTVTLLES